MEAEQLQNRPFLVNIGFHNFYYPAKTNQPSQIQTSQPLYLFKSL